MDFSFAARKHRTLRQINVEWNEMPAAPTTIVSLGLGLLCTHSAKAYDKQHPQLNNKQHWYNNKQRTKAIEKKKTEAEKT